MGNSQIEPQLGSMLGTLSNATCKRGSDQSKTQPAEALRVHLKGEGALWERIGRSSLKNGVGCLEERAKGCSYSRELYMYDAFPRQLAKATELWPTEYSRWDVSDTQQV